MSALHSHDPDSWLETIWNALHSHRETCIPEGVDPAYDEEWDDICSAMAWVLEALGLPGEVVTVQAPTNALRGSRAERLLVAYASRENRQDELPGSDLAETRLSDLLADFMHHARAARMDFGNCLRIAEMHFEAETAEGA